MKTKPSGDFLLSLVNAGGNRETMMHRQDHSCGI